MRDETVLLCEAAICAFEAFDVASQNEQNRWFEWREDNGTVAMRHYAIAVAPFILEVYDLLPQNCKDGCFCYDWCVVPHIVDILEPGDTPPSARYALPLVLAALNGISAKWESQIAER